MEKASPIRIDELKKAAKEGNVTAQFKLGDIYEHGKGVDKDGANAIKYYELAANQGDSEAQLALGFLYSRRKLITHDFEKAKYWFEKAAEQEDEIAQFNLAELYESGKGTDKNYKEAFEWYKKVCKRDNGFAFLALANLYFHGLGTEKDWNAANSWLHRLLNDWEEEDNVHLNLIYLNAKSDDPEAGLLEARKLLDYLIYTKKLSRRKINSLFTNKYEHNLWNTNERMPLWFLPQAEKGNRDALYCIGMIYKYGWTVGKNERLGNKFIELSECADDPQAYTFLARKYENEKDYSYARYLYEKALRYGNKLVTINLAFIFAKGLGVKKDYSKTWRYLKDIFENADSDTIRNITEYVSKNNMDMRSIFREDAEKGNGEAQYYYARQYQKGYGVKINEGIAECWLNKSAGHGLPLELYEK